MFRSLATTRACRYCQRTAIRSYAVAAPPAPPPVPKISHSKSLPSLPTPNPLTPHALAAPSIIKAGTVMKDLSVLKDKPDPVALPDEEYPEWLWTLTDEYAAAKGRPVEGDMGGKGKEAGFDMKAEKKKLRSKNRAEIKSRNFLRTT